MTDLEQTLKKGTLLVIETGEYSDRHWDGPVRMLKSVTKAALVKAFCKQWKPEHEWQTAPDPDHFLPWLIKAGYVEEVDNVHSWHIGSYGTLEP